MPEEVAEETRQLVERLYLEGKAVSLICKRLKVPFLTVYKIVDSIPKDVVKAAFESPPKVPEKPSLQKEYLEDWAKQKGFESYSEYATFRKLVNVYQESLSRSSRNLKYVGYSIESLDDDKGKLIVELHPEEGEIFYEEDVKKAFIGNLQDFSGIVRVNVSCEVSYRDGSIIIDPSDIWSRASLEVYKTPLEREIMK